MSEHINRRKEIFQGVLPKEGTKAFKKLSDRNEQLMLANPHLKKIYKDSFDKAVKTRIVQESNGINFLMDSELRAFLGEFNNRVLNMGLRSMPALFNIMEAFFRYDKSIIYFELLDEEDYLISFYDFLDYYTSDDFIGDKESILNNLEENLIYNYNVGADLEEIKFKSDHGKEFIIGGISMVRHGNEVTMVFITGEITDTTIATDLRDEKERFITPGREKIIPKNPTPLKSVTLNNDNKYWKTLIMCRIDLESNTLDGRYVAKEYDQAYQIKTDEIFGFLEEGKFISEKVEQAYKQTVEEIEKYNPVFELAKATLHLPGYFNRLEENILNETHETNYRELTKNPIKKRDFKAVDNKFKLPTRELFILNSQNKFSPDRIQISDENFKIENTGYWKKLNADEYGMDKNGKQVSGKTWVNRKESFYDAVNKPLVVVPNIANKFSGPNAGFIYVMRNPHLPANTFKIGLTTKTSNERANQLSNTSIPDKHYVMKEWETADCKKAESEIHSILNKYRIDPRREYFEAEMKLITQTVEDVVSKINEEEVVLKKPS